MHPVYLLAFVTFLLVIAFFAWQRISTGMHNPRKAGIGGPNDPMAGANERTRDPDEMRAALDRHTPD